MELTSKTRRFGQVKLTVVTSGLLVTKFYICTSIGHFYFFKMIVERVSLKVCIGLHCFVNTYNLDLLESSIVTTLF